VNRVGFLARRYGFDVLIVIAAMESALEVAVWPAPPRTERWFAVLAIALLILPLLGRRRFPFAAPVALWSVAIAVSFVEGRLVPFTGGAFAAGLAAAFLLGNVRDIVQARLGLAVVLGGAVVVMYNNPDSDPGELIFIPLLFAIGWLAGFAVRERATQAEAAEERAIHAERERAAATRVAVAEERARVARELHDIVAHAVSVMVLQVGAIRHRLDGSLAEEADALRDVERAGRTALAEMRHLLGALRRDGEDVELAPHPGLDGLAGLLDEVGRAGLTVGLHLDGDAVPLPEAIDLSAYRIVQEGLTNVLKHARARHADVTIRYRQTELQIEVRDDGSGGSVDGFGHGLIGIRERVKIYGGELTAEAVPGRGFLLRTRLPLAADVPLAADRP
jgi:signal transduction histidine kinase